MTEFELLMLLQEFSRTISEQFNFWLATTFAMAVASYTAGASLSALLRIAVAILYALACVVFFVRYTIEVDRVVLVSMRLAELGSDFQAPHAGFLSVIRRIVMGGGSALALLMIFRPLGARGTSAAST